jgi:hypothetical protein
MERAVDEKRLRNLLAEGKSQREMAQALKIPRTSLQRIIKNLDPPPPPSPDGSPTTKTPASTSSPIPLASTPVVDAGTLTPAELEAVKLDFWEMIQWWRDRKLKIVRASTPRDTQRQTYHVERRYIELIKHEAEAEGISITEVVNRALGAYFERQKR